LIPADPQRRAVLYSGPAHDVVYIPLFSTRDGLAEFCRRTGLPCHRILRIDDPLEFLDSLRECALRDKLRLMVDPYWTHDDRLRWNEITPI
jgi:hypothetical protein